MSAKTTLTMLLMGLLVVAGCATYDSSVPAATGVGAAGGALIGYGLTGTGTGAALGAGAGALAGAVTGVAIDESRRASAPPPQSYPSAPPPPSSYPAPQAYAPQGDPTQGEFFNSTNWRLEIWVDNARAPVYVRAGESYPIDLDIGVHDVMAKAYVQTQFGERLVGTHQRSINVDPRGSGWSLRFEERMFR